PLFIIRSGVAGGPPNSWGAFTTDAERSSDTDNDPLTDNFTGTTTPLCVYNSRNHRVDVIGFPASGLFRRATANDGSYSSPLTSQDAFIFYEHVRLPTGAGGNTTYYNPGEPGPGNLYNSLA